MNDFTEGVVYVIEVIKLTNDCFARGMKWTSKKFMFKAV